jgi:arylsulfatase A-like enzyme
VAVLFSSTLFLFGPAKLYYTNPLEFKTSFLQQAPLFFAFWTFSILLITLIAVILQGRLYQKFISLSLALSLLLWFQGNILVWQYGLLDGRGIDWDAKAVYGVIDAAVWLSVIVAFFFLSPHVMKIARQAAVALVLLQLIPVLFLIPQGLKESRPNAPATDEEQILSFSRKQNVIVLILDSLQSDYFQEIIDEAPAYRNIFEGFTYYRNATSGYPFTHANPALILTGRYYDNSLPYDEFAKEAFSADSLPKLLRKAGYQVDLLKNEDLALFYVDETIASHLISTNQLVKEEYLHSERVMLEAGLLFDITLFRYLPQTLKKVIFNNQKWFFSKFCLEKVVKAAPENRYMDAWRYRYDIEFIHKMARMAKANTEAPMFKYIHLWIAHPPARVNEYLKYEDLKEDREGYKKQAKGALNLADTFLKSLKNMGIYDRTMLFVLADHGYGHKIEMKGLKQEEASDSQTSSLDSIKGSAYPLFLVKPFGGTGSMKVSDAPVSLSDVAKTIASEVGLEANIPGSSIFAIGESQNRERRFFNHKNARVNTRGGYYLPPLEEYSVSGPVWLDESWRPTHRLLTNEGVKHLH